MFNKSYQLSLTRNYVSRWGVVQAVRELIQNALDSASPFVYEWKQDAEDSWTLLLNSQFATLLPSTLLLGATSKAQDADSIGSFGEGFKIAMLVLLREQKYIMLLNGDKVWTPVFKFSKTFGDDLLVVEETDAENKTNKGLTAAVGGLSNEERDAVIASCLQMQSHVGRIASTQYGDLLFDQKAKLYVGGLFICETEMNYGYNIKPQFITLERDRQTVSNWHLKELTLKIWLEAAPADEIAKLLEKSVPDVEDAQYGMPELVKEECYKLFRSMHPRAIVAASPEQCRKMIEQGLVKTVYLGGGGYYSGISGSNSYRTELTTRPAYKPTTPHDVVSEFYHDYGPQLSKQAKEACQRLVAKSMKWSA